MSIIQWINIQFSHCQIVRLSDALMVMSSAVKRTVVHFNFFVSIIDFFHVSVYRFKARIMASHVPYIVITPCDETLDTGILYYELETNVIFSATYFPSKLLHLHC